MKSKDVIYMIYNEEEQSVASMGIEFHEFVTSLTHKLNNVLLLESGYIGEDYHNGLQLEFVRNEHLGDFYKERVHEYGDFCWVDFEHAASLDRLDPQEKAELLYLGHYKEALNSPFFTKLNNRFVYVAHDDGWFNKIYHKDKTDYLEAMCNLIPNKLKTYKKNLLPIGQDVGNQILSLAKEGILIDLYRSVRVRGSLEVPFHVIGKIMNFDDVYNNMERYKAKVSTEYWLVCNNKEWTIRSYTK